jgi:SagB-type dehydrogenase family enzyme
VKSRPSDDQTSNLEKAALLANSFKSTHPWISSTGLRTHSLRRRTLSQHTYERVAEKFLINTRYYRNDRETELSIRTYFLDSGVKLLSMLNMHNTASTTKILLPPGAPLRRELRQVIVQRRSRRIYTGDPTPLDYIASLLRSAGAVTGIATAGLMQGGEVNLSFRAVPSGGGLYPIDVWLASIRIDGLDPGLYAYDPTDDTLASKQGPSAVAPLLDCFTVPEDIISLRQASGIILLIGRPWRSMRKYGDRGMRLVFLEAGAIAQNIHLSAESLGVGSVDCSSVVDDEIHEVLDIDGLFETLIHTVILGQPA